jgi:Rod binding domain-containing protein
VAINPPSDIVLRVALAADPEKYRAAAERLRELSSAAGAGPEAKDEPRLAESQRQHVDLRSVLPSGTAALQRRTAAQLDAFGEFEAFVLQTFLQSMLPKNATHVFGKGTAGEVWKSMLAEKLAAEIARSGELGLATRLRAHMAAREAGSCSSACPPPSPKLASVLPYLNAEPAVHPPSPAATPNATPSQGD